MNYNYLNPSSNQNTFENNSAPYGNDFSSYPVRVGLINSTKNEGIELKNVGSGIVLDESLKLALIDFDDQVISNSQSDQIIIVPKNRSQAKVGGSNAIVVENGIAKFNTLYLISTPGSARILFSVSSVAINK